MRENNGQRKPILVYLMQWAVNPNQPSVTSYTLIRHLTFSANKITSS